MKQGVVVERWLVFHRCHDRLSVVPYFYLHFFFSFYSLVLIVICDLFHLTLVLIIICTHL